MNATDLTATDLLQLLPERIGNRLAANSECWDWRGWLNDKGYPYVYFEGRDQPAYRVVYRLLVGEIPAGMELDHLCQRPICCAPRHLEPVTHAENQRRIKERQFACRRAGHDWRDPRNVRIRPNGRRYCAECDRQDQRRRRAEKKAMAL